jgi:hypothetical protein
MTVRRRDTLRYADVTLAALAGAGCSGPGGEEGGGEGGGEEED